jgi:hypothetical protein
VTLARIAGVVSKQSANPIPPRRHGDTEEIESSGHRVIGESGEQTANASTPRSVDELRVGSAEVLDSHRPDAFRMKRFAPVQDSASGIRKSNHGFSRIATDSKTDPIRRGSTRMNTDLKSEIKNQKSEISGGSLALRRFRPAIAARVQMESGVPVRMDAGEEHTGEIVWASGPWRASGEWWNEEQWARDTWDVAVAGETVTVCRIFRQRDGREREQWWIEGTYD